MVPGTSPYLICSTVMIEDVYANDMLYYIRCSYVRRCQVETVPLDRVLLLDQGWNWFWSTLILNRLRCRVLRLFGRDGGRDANARFGDL